MYERFTDHARKAVRLAHQEAYRFNHPHVCAIHLFLGLVKESFGLGACALKNAGITLKVARDSVEMAATTPNDTSITTELSETQLFKVIVAYAIEEAARLRHNYIGSEHLLLGILRASNELAELQRVFRNLNINPDQIRTELTELLKQQ